MTIDIDVLVREARELRERLAATAALLDVFTEQLQANVGRLRVVSAEMTENSDTAQAASSEERDDQPE
jgi:hypothetical protein